MQTPTPDTDRQPTVAELEAREWGPGSALPPPVGELPAGGSLWPGGPHWASKISIINQISRAYRFTHDEAVKHNRQNAEYMLNDLVIRDALNSRTTPLRHLSWHLEARDETDPAQMTAVKKLTSVIDDVPNWGDFIDGMAWAIWFGRAGLRLRYEWDFANARGEKRMVVAEHLPIHGDSLVPRWATREWGVLVNGTADVDKQPTDYGGFAHFFTPREAEAVLVHTHLPYDVSFFNPEMAAQIRGSGVRGHIYWAWFLKSQFLALLAEYAERFANGVWIAWFDETNPTGKDEMEAAVAAYRANRVLMLPKNKATQSSAFGLDIREVGTATPQFIMEMINYYDNYIHRYISGQSLADGSEVRVGGDAVGAMEDRIGAQTKDDAVRLAQTLTRQWMPVLTKYNCGPTVPSPRFVFDVDSPDCDDLLTRAKVFYQMGVAVDTDHLLKVCGLPKPSPGDAVATKLSTLNPVAAQQPPTGVPMAAPQQPQVVDAQPQQMPEE